MFWLGAARMASFTCLILLYSVADRYSSSRQLMLATTQLLISATRSTRSRIWAVSLIRCSTFGHLTMSCAASDGIQALAHSVLLLPTPCWPAIRVARLQSPHRAEPPNSSILWAVDTNGVVHAYDAFNVANDIWNSSQNPSDALGAFSKF